jgi:hypothetical protein
LPASYGKTTCPELGVFPLSTDTSPSDEQIVIELANPGLAAFLAWLIPGLGHFYQGRTAKAVLFFVCIMGTFSYGLYLGSSKEAGIGRVVYASWRPTDRRFAYFCQVGVGLPAMPALVQAVLERKGKAPLFGNSYFMARPRLGSGDGDPPTLDRLHRLLTHFFEFGTAYTMIAGLLNVLAIYDAWGGPVFPEPGKEEEEEEEEEEAPSE